MLALTLAATGCIRGEVVRVVDGVEIRGRFVSEWAYAAYAVGAELEARARYSEALDAYRQAASRDDESVEIWARVGALSCVLDMRAEAEDAFAEAQERDPSYEPLWRMRALCAEREERAGDALEAAARAVALDPRRDETVLLYARMLAAAGKGDEAWRWLSDVVLRSPGSLEAWEALEEHARTRRDGWHSEARRRVEALRAARGRVPPEVAKRPELAAVWARVDVRLRADDVEAARALLRTARVDVRLLAARAILVGKPAIALSESALRVAADPDDTTARITYALAADLTGQPQLASDALAALPRGRDRASRVGEIWMAELLLRHAGRDAAQSWLGATSGEPSVSQLREQARAILEQPP
jgi:tetratricopeptide (TPR) repeat protein